MTRLTMDRPHRRVLPGALLVAMQLPPALIAGLASPDALGCVPDVEVAKATAPDAASGDTFGAALSLSGDRALVGAPQLARIADDGGAAYVLERDAGGPDAWAAVVRLVASDIAPDDSFGGSASLDGDRAVVGAPEDDDAGSSSGSAYVFERDAGGPANWGQVAKLTATNAAADDAFGVSVSLSGDRILVGANRHDGVAGNSGSAYVFERDAGGPANWGQVAELTPVGAAADDNFGRAVFLSADRALVGAWGDDDGAPNAGAAHVFERDAGGPGNWGWVAKIVALDPQAQHDFGTVLALSADRAIVGASGDDDGGVGSGAAYVFERDAGGPDAWGQVAKLTATDAATRDAFGVSVAVAGDRVVVGSYQDDDGGDGAGSAYVFERDAGGPAAWAQVAKLTASDASVLHWFGRHVALSGDRVLVSAHLDDDGGTDAGAAYVFGCAGCPDADDDGVTTCEGDCDDAEASAWARPGDARRLRAVSPVRFAWDPPSEPGGAVVAHDVLRSRDPSDFSAAAATCVEVAGADLVVDDPQRPGLPADGGAGLFAYVVRATNACPAGAGVGGIGADSLAVPRPARDCP